MNFLRRQPFEFFDDLFVGEFQRLFYGHTLYHFGSGRRRGDCRRAAEGLEFGVGYNIVIDFQSYLHYVSAGGVADLAESVVIFYFAYDLSDKISAMTDWQSIALNSAETNKKINQAAKKPIKKSWSFTFAAIAAVLVMAIVLPVTLNNKTAPVVAKADYEVIIDVNPTIKLTVNGNNDKVKSQGGMNKDGVEFLYGDNYVGQPINDATKKICDKLQSYGFISVDRPVSVLAQTVDKHGVLSEKQSNIASIIDSVLYGKIESVRFIDDDMLEEIEKNYNEIKGQIDGYVQEIIRLLKGRLKPLIEQKIADIDNLIALFKEKYDDDERVSLDMATMFKVVEFSRKYDYELEFDLVKTKGKYINEFIEDLTDLKEELAECLEEIDEDSDDDYGEILADLIEMAKESIFNN